MPNFTFFCGSERFYQNLGFSSSTSLVSERTKNICLLETSVLFEPLEIVKFIRHTIDSLHCIGCFALDWGKPYQQFEVSLVAFGFENKIKRYKSFAATLTHLMLTEQTNPTIGTLRARAGSLFSLGHFDR